MILRALTAMAAPAGPRSRLSVFYFHRTLAEPDPLLPDEPDARMFDRILGWIGAQFRVLDPLEACERLYDGTLPARPAVITFDDGYRDNYTVALPILQRHRMRAAFFIATGFLDGGMMFNDRVIEAVRRQSNSSIPLPGTRNLLPIGTISEKRHAIDQILRLIKHLPPELRNVRVAEIAGDINQSCNQDLMMKPDDVVELARVGMTIGAHTRSHPILKALNDDESLAEINNSASDLGGILGKRPELFAYPNGRYRQDFDNRHLEMVTRAGFRFAFTTDAGAADRHTQPAAIPRFTPWDRSPISFGVRALRNVIRGS